MFCATPLVFGSEFILERQTVAVVVFFLGHVARLALEEAAVEKNQKEKKLVNILSGQNSQYGERGYHCGYDVSRSFPYGF